MTVLCEPYSLDNSWFTACIRHDGKGAKNANIRMERPGSLGKHTPLPPVPDPQPCREPPPQRLHGGSRLRSLLATLHPTPCTLHPTPYTLHPAPYTLHPAPYNLPRTEGTLSPSSKTQRPVNRAQHLTSTRDPVQLSGNLKGNSASVGGFISGNFLHIPSKSRKCPNPEQGPR